MSADAQSLARSNHPPKRKLRNFLLDWRFQLKYTGMVVAVTVLVAGVLGSFAYSYSRGQTDMLTASKLVEQGVDDAAAAEIHAMARDEDRRVLTGIVGGILALALALGFTGIVVTHKVVGPAFKIRRLLREVADGRLKIESRLRKHDELQDVFEAFMQMVDTLREKQERNVTDLDQAIDQARATGVGEDALEPVRRVRDRLRAEID